MPYLHGWKARSNWSLSKTCHSLSCDLARRDGRSFSRSERVKHDMTRVKGLTVENHRKLQSGRFMFSWDVVGCAAYNLSEYCDRHPSIVNLIRSLETSAHTYLVLEYYAIRRLYEAICLDRRPRETKNV